MEEELKELQYSLAIIDEMTPSDGIYTDALLLKFKNIKIKIYQEKNHKLPHIHIDYNKEYHIASYDIKNCIKIEGNVDNHYDKRIIKWIDKYKKILLKVWDDMQEGKDIKEYIKELSGEF